MVRKIILIISRIDFEAIIWLAAFMYLSLINPYEPKDLELCLFSLVGIENCPGCGLGKSISMIFHGDFINSINSHPLGIPALLLISRRIYQLIRNIKKEKTTNQMEAING